MTILITIDDRERQSSIEEFLKKYDGLLGIRKNKVDDKSIKLILWRAIT